MAFQFHKDRLKHAFGILQNLIVPEANDPITFRAKECRSRRVIGFAMLAAVKLDDQAGIDARKVDNEWANGDLTAELVTAKLTIAEPLPEQSFRLG